MKEFTDDYFVCLFDLILYVPSTIFQLNRDGSSWVEPVLSWDVSCSRTTTQWGPWGSNPQPLGLKSSTLPLSHCAPYIWLRPNRKIPVFRVTRPYLNWQLKPRFFSGFWKKIIISCILKGKMPFKMHKFIFFSRIKKKNVCLPYLK